MSSFYPDGKAVPLDTFSGVWKRVLQSRLLNTNAPGKDSSCIVVVEREVEEFATKRTPRPKYRWSTGRNIDTIQLSYTVEALADMTGGSSKGPSASPVVADAPSYCPLRVNFAFKDCYGMYSAESATLTMHLLGKTNATIVYKLLDEDTMAVSITEIPTVSRAPPIIQTGYMFRVHPPAV